MENIRAATRDDLDTIVSLSRAMRTELSVQRGGALWLAREARPEPLEGSYGALLDRSDTLVVLGLIDDAVIGFGIVAIEELRSGATLGVITDLFVDAGAREVGVGEAILDGLLAFPPLQTCIGIDALALPGSRATKNFFETFHFTARALTMHRPAAEAS